MTDDLIVFALDASRAFGEAIGRSLGVALGAHEEREFEDGEHKCRPLTNVRGRDVFVVQSLYGEPAQSANDKLCRLLFFIGALKDASAGRVTAVVPYLCYTRKDRKTQPRDPVTTRYVAGLFEAVGTDRVLTLDVHNLAAFQNAFRCRTDHLEARAPFVEYFCAKLRGDDVAVVSPDVGGVKRAERFRAALARALNRDVAKAFMEKQRSNGLVSGDFLIGEVSGMSAIIVDDLISTGTTISRAAKACVAAGAKKIYAAASHGIFVDGAKHLLNDPAIEQVVITDTIPPFRVDAQTVRSRLFVIDTAPLFAAAIRAIHEGGSLVDLLEA